MSTLATRYDLRYLAGPIQDQGSTGACMAFAITGAIDLIARQSGNEVAPLSTMQLYTDTRIAMGSFHYDSGSIPEYAFNVAKNTGVAFASSWEYSPENMYNKPTEEVHAEAAQNKISGYTEMNKYQAGTFFVYDVKEMLSQGKPVVLGFRVKDFFFNQIGPLESQTNFGTGPQRAGHAVTIVGYDDNIGGGSYIVKNSWGTSWGDNGYGTISYKQFVTTKIYDSNGNYILPDLVGMWTLDGFQGADFKYTKEKTSVATEYATLLHRAAEVSGLEYWAGVIKNGLSRSDMADMIINSTEGQTFYGSDTNTEFVAEMYENILGRQADSGGLAWWTAQLDSGTSRGTLAVSLMDALKPNTDVVAYDYLYNKTNLSNYISIAMQYQGGHDEIIREAFEDVTSDANNTEIIKVGLVQQFDYLGM